MNDKPNAKIIIFIILSILCVFSLIYGVAAPTKFKRRVSAQFSPVSSQGSVNFIGEGLSLKRNATRSKYSSFSRNPFVIGASIKIGSTDTLEGIIWDEKFPLALINGKTMKIGDRLGSEKVMDIQKNKVILSDGVSGRELKLQ